MGQSLLWQMRPIVFSESIMYLLKLHEENVRCILMFNQPVNKLFCKCVIWHMQV